MRFVIQLFIAVACAGPVTSPGFKFNILNVNDTVQFLPTIPGVANYTLRFRHLDVSNISSTYLKANDYDLFLNETFRVAIIDNGTVVNTLDGGSVSHAMYDPSTQNTMVSLQDTAGVMSSYLWQGDYLVGSNSSTWLAQSIHNSSLSVATSFVNDTVKLVFTLANYAIYRDWQSSYGILMPAGNQTFVNQIFGNHSITNQTLVNQTFAN